MTGGNPSAFAKQGILKIRDAYEGGGQVQTNTGFRLIIMIFY